MTSSENGMIRFLPDFKVKGDLHVFIDECHRTQSGKLAKAMKRLLGSGIFIGFTGTPLFKSDKETSRETFGNFIDTYKFDEAVKDGAVLDLRYEARNVDQDFSPKGDIKLDERFERLTTGMTDEQKYQLKQKWGTMKALVQQPGAAGTHRRQYLRGHGS